MEVISKPKYYKVKCDSCYSTIKFNYYEITKDYNPKNFSINCPVCHQNIPVGIKDSNNYFNMLNNVEPIYEE